MPWISSWFGLQTAAATPSSSTVSDASYVDPEAATPVLVPGVAASSAPPRLRMVAGSAANFALQCWNLGRLSAPVFAAGDILAASLWQEGVRGAPIAAPTPSWYTSGNTQTGHDQGQLVVSFSAAQSILSPTGGPVSYRLVVTRAPAGDTGNPLPIVRLPLRVESAY